MNAHLSIERDAKPLPPCCLSAKAVDSFSVLADLIVQVNSTAKIVVSLVTKRLECMAAADSVQLQHSPTCCQPPI